MYHFIYSFVIICILMLSNCAGNDSTTSTKETISADSIKDSIHMVPNGNKQIRINNIGSYREVFNDSNKYHYYYAEKLGITPITNIKNLYNTIRPIVKITENEFYYVDSLTHSLPYLVPEAARLLEDIGRNFIDTLSRRGGGYHKIKVTSLLRTPSTIKHLRRVNINASDSSTHQFATTFDISWSKFYCSDTTKSINSDILKRLLAEVLLDLRNQNRCLIKYERKTACFHITVTQ